MTSLSELPWPSGSPHFEILGGNASFVWDAITSETIQLRYSLISLHERTIICAVAECWFRRKAEEHGAYAGAHALAEKELAAADAWAQASQEKE